jgi:hypothetical protein
VEPPLELLLLEPLLTPELLPETMSPELPEAPLLEVALPLEPLEPFSLEVMFGPPPVPCPGLQAKMETATEPAPINKPIALMGGLIGFLEQQCAGYSNSFPRQKVAPLRAPSRLAAPAC